MKFRSMKAVYKLNKTSAPWTLLEGEFCYNKDFTNIICWPPTDGESNGIRTLDIIANWTWDKNVESPTLEGSIGCGEDHECWHGYLKAGYWKACE